MQYLYHGSRALFRKPEIYDDPKMWNHHSTYQGPGLYCTFHKQRAKKFGPYVYTIVLAGPLPDIDEIFCIQYMKKACRYLAEHASFPVAPWLEEDWKYEYQGEWLKEIATFEHCNAVPEYQQSHFPWNGFNGLPERYGYALAAHIVENMPDFTIREEKRTHREIIRIMREYEKTHRIPNYQFDNGAGTNYAVIKDLSRIKIVRTEFFE